MEKALDCRGLQCPEPVARCKELLKDGRPDVLRVTVDNQAALENVSRFLKNNGYGVAAAQTGPDEWHITGTLAQEVQTRENEPEATDARTLVLITTETLGRGDDELGAKLMDTFLANLSDLGPSLWRIVLLNGGVKLAATEAPALDHLKRLAEAGISILVCGTCLMHYGLLENKQVGETTNMMDVIGSLGLAQKVIRP